MNILTTLTKSRTVATKRQQCQSKQKNTRKIEHFFFLVNQPMVLFLFLFCFPSEIIKTRLSYFVSILFIVLSFSGRGLNQNEKKDTKTQESVKILPYLLFTYLSSIVGIYAHTFFHLFWIVIRFFLFLFDFPFFCIIIYPRFYFSNLSVKENIRFCYSLWISNSFLEFSWNTFPHVKIRTL